LGDIDATLAKEHAEKIGVQAIGLEVDISSEDSFASFIGSVESQLGPVDVLINNA
jgi:NAD(P)-dependent dehydrogenase (short-subunit alcohol dehydrogenase family)